MTINDSVQTVVNRMNRSDTDITTSAVNWLVQAYLDIAARYPFVELQRYATVTTVAGQREYSLPDGVRAVLALALEDPLIVNANGTPLTRRLKKTSFRDIIKANFNIAQVPVRYARWNDKFFIDPIPDRSTYRLKLFGWIYPDTTSRENTTVLLPPEWIEVMEWHAVWRGLCEHIDYDAANNVLKNILSPLEMVRNRNLKSYLEMQDWDSPVEYLQTRSTPTK